MKSACEIIVKLLARSILDISGALTAQGSGFKSWNKNSLINYAEMVSDVYIDDI